MIYLCRICCQKCTFYKSHCGYCDVFHNPVLQPTLKNCILYGCICDSIHVYTAVYLLVLAGSGTADVKVDKVTDEDDKSFNDFN